MLNTIKKILLSYLVCNFGFAATAVLPGGEELPIERVSPQISQHPVRMDIDAFLDSPSITVGGKEYPVKLSKNLKSELQKKTASIISVFEEDFNKVKTRNPSDRVIGFYFNLHDGKIFSKSYLGENAE